MASIFAFLAIVIPISVVQGLEISFKTLVTFPDRFFNSGFDEGPVAIVNRFDPAAINRQQRAAKEIKAPA
jgi:hypothetical protein